MGAVIEATVCLCNSLYRHHQKNTPGMLHVPISSGCVAHCSLEYFLCEIPVRMECDSTTNTVPRRQTGRGIIVGYISRETNPKTDLFFRH